MGRRKKGSPVHGWVVVDKPQGITSTQVVAVVRRVFDAQKAGHAGTLDPMATGVLAIALGEATKTVPYAMDAEKTYRFTACWGEGRDSDDADGAVTSTSDKRPSRAEIEAAMGAFIGLIEQTPPAYSAMKVDGERAYDLARDGETVELRIADGVRAPGAPSRRCLMRTMPSSKCIAAKALTCAPGCAIWPWRWAPAGMFRPCAAPAWAPSRLKMQ